MMNAYDKIYLEKSQITLGNMLDSGINRLGYKLQDFWNLFLSSEISKRYEKGDSTIIGGKSGVELSYIVCGKENHSIEVVVHEDRSPEYWAGWALSYYQWKSGLSFYQITQAVSIENVVAMYSPYHEMDIRHFCNRMDQLLKKENGETNLKRLRSMLGMTQKQLSEETEIPLRTIQQYEQRQKNINHACFAYLVAFSKALYCSPEDLVEKFSESER